MENYAKTFYNAELKEWSGNPGRGHNSNISCGEILINALQLEENNIYQVILFII